MLRLITALFLLGSIQLIPDYSDSDVDKLHNQVYELLDSNPDSAMVIATHTLELSRKHDYIYGEANSLFLQADVYEQKRQFTKAMINYLLAIRLLEDQKDIKSINTRVKMLNNCAGILKKHFKYNEAIEYAEKAVVLAESNELSKRLIEVYYNQCQINKDKGDYPTAREYALKCLKLSLQKKNEYMALNSLNMLGIIYAKSEDFETSREYYHGIIDFDFKQLKPSKYVGRAYHNLASSYMMQDDYITAEKYYLKALEEKHKRNKASELFITYLDMCQIYQALGDLNNSKIMGDLAHNIYNKMSLRTKNYRLYNILSNTYHQLGEHDKAIEFANFYSDENTRFLDAQQLIIQEKDKFKMDLVLAGFNQEIANNNKISYLQWWIYGLAGLAIAVFLMMQVYWKWKKHLVKKDFDNLDFPDFTEGL